jgi:hypothetical protein
VNTLCLLLHNPGRAAGFSGRGWDDILVQARQARLLGRLAAHLDQVPGLEVPSAVADVLRGAGIMIAHLHRRARFELRGLEAIARSADYPVVLLKGAAYLAADLPAASGRSLSDIDVLVPKKALARFESALHAAGWKFDETLTSYDEHYYRNWSHELPPLRHPERQYELDVHHTLVQPTSRMRLDTAALFEAIVPIAGTPFFRLGDEDLVLHSAAHLFMTDELRGGLRDVVDMALLCRVFAARDDDFWCALARRGRALGLQRPLFYALDAMRHLIAVPVPEDALSLAAVGRPGPLRTALMRRLIAAHLAPAHPGAATARLSERLLYLRSHWIRMPPLLLARHLLTKAFLRRSVA